VINEKVLQRIKKKRNVLLAMNRRKASWIGHIMRENYLIKQIIEEEKEGKYKLGKNEEEEVSSYWITLRR
jgi:Zn-dependent peptidase ImmA (M78 family)